jgi:tetratricopeptide (TPR) repeat protein
MRKIFTSVFILTSLISFGQNAALDDLWKLYNSQDLKSVIEKAKPLIEKDPNNIELNLIMGRSLTNQADFKNALPYLELAVKKDNTNSWQKAWALSYLGTCYFMLQDYNNSESSLNECINLNATKNATNNAYGQTLLFGFNEFYKTWKIVETDNFRFHFQNMNAIEIEKYTSDREVAYKEINSFFKSTLPKKIDFYIWESREDAMKVLKANLGFAKPNFCIVHTHYQQTIGHEMTHVISNYTTEITNKTRFISEGTAVCFDLTNHDKFKLVKDWTAANNKQIEIKDCWANGEKYGEDILYPLSGLFVKELIANFGKEKFLEFFKNQTYENAKLVFGNKLDTMIEEFEKKINT